MHLRTWVTSNLTLCLCSSHATTAPSHLSSLVGLVPHAYKSLQLSVRPSPGGGATGAVCAPPRRPRPKEALLFCVAVAGPAGHRRLSAGAHTGEGDGGKTDKWALKAGGFGVFDRASSGVCLTAKWHPSPRCCVSDRADSSRLCTWLPSTFSKSLQQSKHVRSLRLVQTGLLWNARPIRQWPTWNAFERRTKHSGPTSQLAASVLLSPWPDQAQMRAVCQLYCPRESNSDNKNNTHTHTQGSPGMNGTFIQQLLMVQNAAGEAKLSNTSSMSARWRVFGEDSHVETRERSVYVSAVLVALSGMLIHKPLSLALTTSLVYWPLCWLMKK